MVGNLAIGPLNDTVSLVGKFVFDDIASPPNSLIFNGFLIEYNGLLGIYTPITAQTM